MTAFKPAHSAVLKSALAASLAIASFAVSVSAVAQTPAAPAAPVAAPVLPGYGLSINSEQAKKMMAAAEAHAKANNWVVGIAIVDTAAQLVMFSKADGLQHASVQISIGKAVTALNFRRPTKALEDGVAAGGVGLRILSVPGAMALEGGIPIVVDGRIIGAIGVSGVASSNDALIARAGIDALGK